MKIIDIKDIVRKDVPIYYKRFYKGILAAEIMDKIQEVPVEFIIEHKPTGDLDIKITLGETVDYPLAPLLKELRNYIADLDETRKLPL